MLLWLDGKTPGMKITHFSTHLAMDIDPAQSALVSVGMVSIFTGSRGLSCNRIAFMIGN